MPRGPTEEEVSTFEGWLFCTVRGATQKVFPMMNWLGDGSDFLKPARKSPNSGPLGKLKLTRPGDLLYAVAIQDTSDLWLTFWVRRSPKGGNFRLLPAS